MNEPTELWRRHARQWRLVGQPLRPTPDDTRFMETTVATRSADARLASPQAIMLGVTPEIASMSWPPATNLVAVDRSCPMITEIWPGDTDMRHAVCANWFAVPLRPGSLDFVVGDGILNMLPSATAYDGAVRAMRAMLAPHGRMILRIFVQPDEPESPEAVLETVAAGGITNFHVFKWRLVMSLQRSVERGVALADVWKAWNSGVQDAPGLAERMGWSSGVAQTIEAYREIPTRFTYPSLAELRRALEPAFIEESVSFPDYELGERCPTFVWSPRGGRP